MDCPRIQNVGRLSEFEWVEQNKANLDPFGEPLCPKNFVDYFIY